MVHLARVVNRWWRRREVVFRVSVAVVRTCRVTKARTVLCLVCGSFCGKELSVFPSHWKCFMKKFTGTIGQKGNEEKWECYLESVRWILIRREGMIFFCFIVSFECLVDSDVFGNR